jgi:heme/copper-type cytochrome/quinol oxidase subunit 2
MIELNPCGEEKSVMRSGFKENIQWLTLVSVAVIYGYYLSKVLPPQGPDITREQIVLFASMVVLLVVITIIGAIFLVALEKYREPKDDERDKLIALKGNSIAGWVLTIGVIAAMHVAWLVPGNFWIMHALLMSLVVSQLADSATRIFHYRLGS